MDSGSGTECGGACPKLLSNKIYDDAKVTKDLKGWGVRLFYELMINEFNCFLSQIFCSRSQTTAHFSDFRFYKIALTEY